MARAEITIQAAKKPFDIVSAGNLDFTFAASDDGSGNSYVVTGKELLIAHNDGSVPHTMTIDSTPDEKNRERDITDYSLAAGDYIAFTGGLTTSKGWQQTGGVIHIDTNSDNIKVAVLRLP